jgi:hypothetical protein
LAILVKTTCSVSCWACLASSCVIRYPFPSKITSAAGSGFANSSIFSR